MRLILILRLFRLPYLIMNLISWILSKGLLPMDLAEDSILEAELVWILVRHVLVGRFTKIKPLVHSNHALRIQKWILSGRRLVELDISASQPVEPLLQLDHQMALLCVISLPLLFFLQNCLLVKLGHFGIDRFSEPPMVAVLAALVEIDLVQGIHFFLVRNLGHCFVSLVAMDLVWVHLKQRHVIGSLFQLDLELVDRQVVGQ